MVSGDEAEETDSNDSLSRLVAFSLLLLEQANKSEEDEDEDEEDEDVIGGVVILFRSLTKQFSEVAWFEWSSASEVAVAFKAIRLFKLTMS